MSARKIFKGSELSFLKSQDVARLATASKDATPQVTPVVYAMDGENMIIATDYGTRKLKNLKENPKTCAVVDEYNPNKGIIFGATAVFTSEAKSMFGYSKFSLTGSISTGTTRGARASRLF